MSRICVTTSKRANICVFAVSRRREKMWCRTNIWSYNDRGLQVWQDRSKKLSEPQKDKLKKTQSQCIIIKWLKTKEKRKYLESSQRKTVYFIIWITSDFFSETVEVKSKKNNILKCWKKITVNSESYIQ